MLAVFYAVLYGILNDQITVSLAPEYFSVFKRAQFAPALEMAGLVTAPTRVQAVLVGTLATWWFGLFLGIVLSVSGQIGRTPPLGTRDYVRAVLWIMGFTLCLSALFGLIAYCAAPIVQPTADQWPFLTGIRDVRAAFAVGWWHNGAYLGGFLGTILAGVRGQYRRRKAVAARAVP
jgi:hypothetical protein